MQHTVPRVVCTCKRTVPQREHFVASIAHDVPVRMRIVAVQELFGRVLVRGHVSVYVCVRT